MSLPLAMPVFGSVKEKFHLDIGCASGNYLIRLAKRCPQTNFLGLEIREKLVLGAKCKRDAEELDNIDFLVCNVIDHSSMLKLFAAIPAPTSASIFHPDPNFKARHRRKRDIVTQSFLGVVASAMNHEGNLHIQTDVEEVFLRMVQTIEEHENWALCRNNFGSGENLENALGEPTDRELYAQRLGLPIYRASFACAKIDD